MSIRFAEVRQLLRSSAVARLHGKGVSDKQIEDCQRRLGISLPPSYRDFLREFGWGYFGSLEVIAGLGDDIPREWVNGVSIDVVVAYFRLSITEVPETVIPFCVTGAGDWYALDCRSDESVEAPVLFISHERAAVRGYSADQQANSFAGWVKATLAKDG